MLDFEKQYKEFSREFEPEILTDYLYDSDEFMTDDDNNSTSDCDSDINYVDTINYYNSDIDYVEPINDYDNEYIDEEFEIFIKPHRNPVSKSFSKDVPYFLSSGKSYYKLMIKYPKTYKVDEIRLRLHKNYRKKHLPNTMECYFIEKYQQFGSCYELYKIGFRTESFKHKKCEFCLKVYDSKNLLFESKPFKIFARRTDEEKQFWRCI